MLAVAVLIAAAPLLVLVVFAGDDDFPAASGRSNSPTCGPGHERSFICPESERFDVKSYTEWGATFPVCAMFASQADAQAVLRANPDLTGPPSQPLDANRDGIACPQLPGPRDMEPIAEIVERFECRRSDPRSARCPESWRSFSAEQNLASQSDEFDCKDYARQTDAQAVLRFQPQDPNKLDGEDGEIDGIACPDLPGPKDLKPVRVVPAS